MIPPPLSQLFQGPWKTKQVSLQCSTFRIHPQVREGRKGRIEQSEVRLPLIHSANVCSFPLCTYITGLKSCGKCKPSAWICLQKKRERDREKVKHAEADDSSVGFDGAREMPLRFLLPVKQRTIQWRWGLQHVNMPKQTLLMPRPHSMVPSILSQSLCKECMGQASHSLIWVLALCSAAAVLKACFRVSMTSSTYKKKQNSGL